MKFLKINIIIGLSFLLNSINAQKQDTIRYEGTLGIMLFESIELYPNNYFKWTSEYDLSWSEFGLYENNGKDLILKFYDNLDESNKILSENENSTHTKTEILMIDGNQLFRLNKKGKKIKRIRDKSFKYKLSWLFGHKYQILKI